MTSESHPSSTSQQGPPSWENLSPVIPPFVHDNQRAVSVSEMGQTPRSVETSITIMMPGAGQRPSNGIETSAPLTPDEITEVSSDPYAVARAKVDAAYSTENLVSENMPKLEPTNPSGSFIDGVMARQNMVQTPHKRLSGWIRDGVARIRSAKTGETVEVTTYPKRSGDDTSSSPSDEIEISLTSSVASDNLPPNFDFEEETEDDSNPTTSPSSTMGPANHVRYYSGDLGPDAPIAADSDRLGIVQKTREGVDKEALLSRYQSATNQVIALLEASRPNSALGAANWSGLGKSTSGNSVAYVKDGWEETLPPEVAQGPYKHLKVEVMRTAKSPELSNGLALEKLNEALHINEAALKNSGSRIESFKLRREIDKQKNEKKELLKRGARTEFLADEGSIEIKLIARPSRGELREDMVSGIEYKKFKWPVKPDERYIDESLVLEIERALSLIKGEAMYEQNEAIQESDHTKTNDLLDQGMALTEQVYRLLGRARHANRNVTSRKRTR